MTHTRVFVLTLSIATGLSMLIAVVAGIARVWAQFGILGVVVLGCAVALAVAGTIFAIAWLALTIKGKQLEHEQVRFQTYLVAPGDSGNYPIRWNGQSFIQPTPGNCIQPMPHIYSPRISHAPARTVVKEEKPAIPQAPSIHIPTFSECMAQGLIGPGQTDMLFCHELLADETTGLYIAISPIVGAIAQLHTQFIAGGSQSGKSTYMAGVIAQAVAMGALLYVIDPHKAIAEKSLTGKIAAFSDYFILPPASTHTEIGRLITHAAKLRDARLNNKATRYGNGPIMVVVDEVPALMAWQHSKDRDIRQLYINLALFMASIGTQTAKVGVTGLYGSQYATKDELGEIEIRDACMSQLLLRLPPTQAQAMRILGKHAVASMPKLQQGHGYLMLSDGGEPLRVASGNVTTQDVTQLARMLPPSPLKQEVSRPFQVVSSPEIAVSSPETDGLKQEVSGLETVSETIHETTWQAKVDTVREMKFQRKTQSQIIEKVWKEKPGGTVGYKNAVAEFRQIEKQLATE